MDIFEVEDIGTIRKITINNPRKKNALNRKAYIAMAKLLNEAGKDNKVKCLVLTGKGDFYRYKELRDILLISDL
jgi:peroxisomal 3,2-trans-enoyl-CoA isomerase